MKREKIKGFWLGVIVTIICSTLVATVGASVASRVLNAEFRDIKITIDDLAFTPKDANGNELEPFIVDGSTYLPVRAVADAVGYDVAWDGDTNTVKLSKKDTYVSSSLEGEVNKEEFTSYPIDETSNLITSTEPATQPATQPPTESPTKVHLKPFEVILNTSTHVYHLDPNCRAVKLMKDENRAVQYVSNRSEISSEYSPCGTCSDY